MKHALGAAPLVVLICLWSMMLLGAIVLETFTVYPNVFRDPPRSLELAHEASLAAITP
jgi:hypothetical protein